VILISAIEELAQRRGVDPKNPAAEMHFINYMNKSPMLRVDPVAVTTAVALVVQAAAKIYEAFAKIFATTETTKLIGEFKSKGFTSYALKANVRRYIGIQGTKLDEFTGIVSKDLTKNHPKWQKEVKATISGVKFIPDFAWKMDDIAIDTAKPDSTDIFFTILYNNENRGTKYNFMALSVDSTFTLAPNLLIYKQSTSVVGGLFGSEKAIFQEVPRTVTEKDINALRYFNLVLTTKLFSENAGDKKLPWPTMPK